MQKSGSSKHPYSKVMSGVSWLFALLGMIAGCWLLYRIAEDPSILQESRRPWRLLAAPLAFGVLGYLIGTAFGVMFAPTAFLVSRSGEKWMKRVGTNSPVVAKIAAVVLMVLVIMVTSFFVILSIRSA